MRPRILDQIARSGRNVAQVLPIVCALGTTWAVCTVADSSDSSIALPAVSGSYAIGTLVLDRVDSARVDTTTGTLRARPLGLQVWYPAEPGVEPRAPYASRVDTTGSDYGR